MTHLSKFNLFVLIPKSAFLLSRLEQKSFSFEFGLQFMFFEAKHSNEIKTSTGKFNNQLIDSDLDEEPGCFT